LIRRLVIAVFVCGMVTIASAETKINGAGATFPNPIYSKWFSTYHDQHSDIFINYQPVGSGGGIRQLTAGTVDFGASDAPMTDEQIAEAQKNLKVPVYHFPTVLGAVVPAYNVPGVSGDLKFTADVIADIYNGTIKSWNDPQLVKLNPDVKLPNQEIIVVHRSDGSGTTYIFTDYLTKASKHWTVGKGPSVNWPGGLGGKGNDGVAGYIRGMVGAIGYIELIYAEQNHIPFGIVQNASGNFVKASVESVTAAAASAKMPADFRVSITNAPGKESYPISSFTWLLVPQKQADAGKQQVIKDFLQWMLTSGQGYTKDLVYGRLPEEVVKKEQEQLKQLQ
jgi:phosphate transport system substrate-binding protein